MITFPTTPEAFIAYQESIAGRKLNGLERDIAAEVADLINISYREGIEGRAHTVSMEAVETFTQEPCQEGTAREFSRLWKCICGLCDKAYQAGREVSRHG